MTVLEVRGGEPSVQHLTIPAAGRRLKFPLKNRAQSGGMVIKRLRVTNHGGAQVRLYFSEADFTEDVHYYPLAVGETFSEPLELREMWIRGAAEVTVIGMQRRG